MCNCSPNPASICQQCSQGNPCGCPPNYAIIPIPVSCGCCPGSLTYYQPTQNWPNGYCADSQNQYQVPPIPCPSCAETISADCVILPAVPCLGIPAGTTLSQLAAFLCSSAFIQLGLSTIGINPSLGSAFCQLVQNCPPSGSGTTPIITSIIVTFP